MNTLYLAGAPTAWDLAVDASGNIAIATEPYSLAQDAASQIKTFLGECYYDTALGIPYFQQILGQSPSLQLLKTQLVAAALKVPGVTAAQVFISSAADRQVTGQVQITDASGNLASIGF